MAIPIANTVVKPTQNKGEREKKNRFNIYAFPSLRFATFTNNLFLLLAADKYAVVVIRLLVMGL